MGDPKAPSLIATTASCRKSLNTFHWTSPLTLDSDIITLSGKQGGIKYYFWSFLNQPVIETSISQTIGKHSNRYAMSPGNQFSIPGRVILKTRKMVLDTTLLKTQL